MATNLFQLGDFVLASGAQSKWRLELDALTDDDWRALAEMVRQMVGPFSSVEGVPRGGLKLAECLRPFAGLSGRHLIVDDVLTTGGSLRKVTNAWMTERYGEDPTYWPQKGYPTCAVVFARGQLPWNVAALFCMPKCFWLKPLTRGA